MTSILLTILLHLHSMVFWYAQRLSFLYSQKARTVTVMTDFLVLEILLNIHHALTLSTLVNWIKNDFCLSICNISKEKITLLFCTLDNSYLVMMYFNCYCHFPGCCFVVSPQVLQQISSECSKSHGWVLESIIWWSKN